MRGIGYRLRRAAAECERQMSSSNESSPGPQRRGRRDAVLIGLFVVVAVVLALRSPIRQPLAYHDFADQRTLLGVPNFMDVFSNLLFLVAGLWGMVAGFRRAPTHDQPWEVWAWRTLFLGIGLTFLGSGFYHLAPDNLRLFWDRLPMTICFSSLFGLLLAERVSMPFGRRTFALWLLFGAGSALYWHLGERAGDGNLAPYALVQLYPLLALPLMLLLYPPRYTRAGDLWLAIGCYAVAKVFELLDRPIFELGHLISGHSLKHLAAGVATLLIVRMALRRERYSGAQRPAEQ